MAGNRQQFTLQFNADISQAKSALQDLNKSLKAMTQLQHFDAGLHQDITEAANAARILQQELQRAVSVDTGKLDIGQFAKGLSQSGTSLRELSEKLLNAGQVGQTAFNNLTRSILATDVPIRKMNKTLANALTTLKNTIKWELSSNLVHGLESAFSGAISYAKELNTSLTNIRIVTNQSVEDMAKFTEQANKAAKSLSTTTKAYTDASLIYYQQGDSPEEAAKKAAITIKAANASFGSSAKEMSEYLTAVWNSYQVGADELEHYVDIMASLGAKTATSLEEIATSMQKVAATANTVGVSMEQVSSIISTVSSVTRESAESIGTSFKTIFARIGDLKLGQTLEDGVNLGQVSSQLQKIGVSVLDANGDLRDMGIVIEELMTKWDAMTKAEQTAIAQVIAGKRQYTQWIALMENSSMYEQNMNIAKNSEGSLQKMHDTYAESWEAASKKVQASLEGIYGKLINDQAMIKMTNALNTVVNVISEVIDGLGGLPGILATLGNTFTTIFRGKIAGSINGAIESLSNWKKSFQKMSVGDSIKSFFKGDSAATRDYNRLLAEARNISVDQTSIASTQREETDWINTTKIIEAKQRLVDLEHNLSDAQRQRYQDLINNTASSLDAVQRMTNEYTEQQASIDKLVQSFSTLTAQKEAYERATGKTNTNLSKSGEKMTDHIKSYWGNKIGAFEYDSGQIMRDKTVGNIFNANLGIANAPKLFIDDAVIQQADVSLEKLIQRFRILEQASTNFSTTAVGFKDALNQLSLNNTNVADSLTRLDTLIDNLKLSFKGTGVDTSWLDILQQKLHNNSTNSDDFRRALQSALDQINAASTTAGASAGQAFSILSSKLGVSTEQLNNIREQAGLSSQKFLELAQSLGLLNNNVDHLGSSLKKGIGDSLAKVANGAMSALSAFSSMSYAIQNLDTMSATQQITSFGNVIASTITQFASGNIVGGVMSMIGAGIGAIIGQIEKAKKEFQELQKKQLETISTQTEANTNDNASKQELLHNYQSLYETYLRTGDGQDALRESAYALAEAYGLVGKNVLIATGNFETFNKEIVSTLDFQTQYDKIKQLQDASFQALDSSTGMYAVSAHREDFSYITDDNLKEILKNAREQSALARVGGGYDSLNYLFGGNAVTVTDSTNTYNLVKDNKPHRWPWEDTSYTLNYNDIQSYLLKHMFNNNADLTFSFMQELYSILTDTALDDVETNLNSEDLLKTAYDNIGQISGNTWSNRLYTSSGGTFIDLLSEEFMSKFSSMVDGEINSFVEDMQYDSSKYFTGDALDWNNLDGQKKYERYKELQTELTDKLQPAIQAVQDKIKKMDENDPYYEDLTLYLDYLQSIKDAYESVTENENIKAQMTNIADQNALLESLKLRQAQLTNFFGKNEANTDFSSFVSDMSVLQTSIDKAMEANKDAFESLSEYMVDEDNDGQFEIDSNKINEYNVAREKIISQFLNDYTSFDDYLKIYEDVVNRFSDTPILKQQGVSAQEKVFQFIQEAGIKTINEFTNELMNAIEILISRDDYDFLNNNLVQDILTANKQETAFVEAKNKSDKASSYADNFAEDMSIDEATTFYKAIEWGKGTEAGTWDDFLAMDYEQREAHIQNLADIYENTAEKEAVLLRDSRKKSYEDWKALINDEYSNFYGAIGDFTHGDKNTGFDAVAHQQAFLAKMKANGYTWDESSQSYIAKGKQALNKETAWQSYIQEAKDQGANISENITYAQVEHFLSVLQDTNNAYIQWVDAEGVVHAFELIDSAVESNTTKIQRLINAVKQLPTSSEELRKIADALGMDMNTLINSSETERAVALAANMKKPTLKQSGIRNYSDIYEYLDAHPELTGQAGFKEAQIMWNQPETYSTDQDYANYIEETHSYQEGNALNAQYQEQIIRNGAIETLATIEELSSALSSIDISNLPEQGTKAYEQLQRALAKVNISIADFMAMNDSSKYTAIAKAQNKLIDEEIIINKQLQNYYASIMNDTSGKYDEDARMKAVQNYYDTVAEGNKLILDQEQNIANARAQAAEVYAQQADIAKAQMEEAKKEAEELKTIAEVMSDAIKTGEFSNESQELLSQAGYLDDWKNTTNEIERAAIAFKAWSQYAADTEAAGEALATTYNQTAHYLDAVLSKNKTFSADQKDFISKDGQTILDLQNRNDYLEYLRKYTDMTEEQIGHIGKAWDRLKGKGIDLSTKTNAEITELLADELIAMGVEVDEAWRIAAANAKDAMAEAAKGMAEDHAQAAQDAITAWESAFNRIAELRKKILSGESILEDIFGGGLDNLWQQFKDSGYSDYASFSNDVKNGKYNPSLPAFDLNKYLVANGIGQFTGLKTEADPFVNRQQMLDAYKNKYIADGGDEGNAGTYARAQVEEDVRTALTAYNGANGTNYNVDEAVAAYMNGDWSKKFDDGTGRMVTASQLFNMAADTMYSAGTQMSADMLWYQKQQEIMSEGQGIVTTLAENQTYAVGTGEANQEELLLLQAAIQRAQEEKYTGEGDWSNLSSTDQELLSSYGIGFDNVDMAAEQCANGLIALAEVAYQAMEAFLLGKGYEHKEDGWYDSSDVLDEGMTEYMDGLDTARKNAYHSAEDDAKRLEKLQEESKEKEWEGFGLDPDEVDEFGDHLQGMAEASEELSDSLKDNADVADEVAKEIMRFGEACKDVRENYEDWIDVLESDNMEDQAKVIKKMDKAYSDMLDLDYDTLSDQFLRNTDNLELMKQAAEGSEEAYNSLQEAARNDIAMQIGLDDTDFQNQFNNLLQQYYGAQNLDDIEIGAALNDAGFLAALSRMVTAAGMTAEQATDYLASMGVDATVKTKKTTSKEIVGNSLTAHPGVISVPYTVPVDGGQGIRGGVATFPYVTYTSEPVYATKETEAVALEVTSAHKSSGGGFKFDNSSGASGSGSRGGGGGGGGGGGKQPKSLDKKKPEDEKERYHTITKSLDRLTDALETVDKLKDRAYGKNHLTHLEQEISLLKDEIKLQEEYLRQAQEWLAIDAQRVSSIGAVFDDKGNIANYEELMDSIINKYNAFIDRYNAASASAQEGMDKEKEEWDKWYEERMEWISQYEETLALVYDKQNEILELQNQISEKTLEKIQYKVEYKVEINESEKDYLDYINDKYDEVLDKQDLLMDNYIRQGQIAEENLSYLATAKEELEAAYAAGELNQADYVAGLQDIQDQILENLEAIQEIKKLIEELYGKTLDLASEELDKHTSKIEAASEAMGSYMSILQLMGKGQTFEDLLFFYQKQYEYNMSSLESQMAYLEVLKQEEQYYLDRMHSAEGLTETERIQYEDLQETLNEVQANILSKTEETLQALKDMYDTTIEDIMKDLEEAMVGVDNDLAWLTEEYGFYTEEIEQYVSSQRELYEISKLNRNIQKSINDTTSNIHKKQLKSLQDEINAQSELKELSEYEIEMMNLKYELLLKQIALEEAQNAKNTVRLTRDSEGNMIYQYTADQDAIDQAQQEYEDVLQKMADTNWEYEQNIYNQTLQLRQETLEAIKEIAMDETLTEEQKQQRINEILDHYYESARYLQEQYNIVSANTMQTNELIAEHYGIAVSDIADRTKDTVAEIIGEMINHTDNYRAEMEDAYEKIKQAMQDYADKIDAVTELTNTNYESMIDSVKTYDEVTEDAKQETMKMTETLKNELTQIHVTTTAWDNYYKKLASVISQYEAMYQAIQNTIKAQSQLANASAPTPVKVPTGGGGGSDTTPSPHAPSGGSGGGGGGSGGGGGGGRPSGSTSRTRGFKVQIDGMGAVIVQASSISEAIKKSGAKATTSYGYSVYDAATGNLLKRVNALPKPKPTKPAGGGGGCFVAGTKIVMGDGSIKNIENVLDNDFVLAYNTETGLFEPYRVIKSYPYINTPRVINITLSDGTILGITPSHPILTSAGWKSRDQALSLKEHGVVTEWLELGDEVLQYNSTAKVIRIEEQEIPENYTTYNLWVDECHTYIADGVIVHNAIYHAAMTKAAYATGGLADYTGPAWVDGSPEKPELVLNPEDTQNMFRTVNAVRQLDKSTLSLMDEFINLATSSMMSNLINIHAGAAIGNSDSEFEQNVHITAEFPNVQDSNEIQDAFDNLINRAAQYIGSKRR